MKKSLLPFAALAAAATIACGQRTLIWDGTTDTNWDTSSANWHEDGAANGTATFANGDTAIFNQPASVLLTANITVNDLLVQQGATSWSLDGAQLTIQGNVISFANSSVIKSKLTGTGGIIINRGALQLENPGNDFSGELAINNASLVLRLYGDLNNSPFGTGPIFGNKGGLLINYSNANGFSYDNYAYNMSFPALTFTNDFSIGYVQKWGSPAEFTFDDIIRAPGGVLRFSGNAGDLGGAVKIKTLGNLPNPLPAHFICGIDDRNDLSLMTYGATGFKRVNWNPDISTITDLMNSDPADCVSYTGGDILATGNLTLHAFRMTGGDRIFNCNTHTLTLSSGAIFSRQKPQYYNNGVLNFNGNEAIVYAWGDNSVVLNARITNATGLVWPGTGEKLVINSPANDFRGGPVYIYGGELQVGDRALPDGTRLYLTPGSRLYCNTQGTPSIRLAGLYGNARIYHGWSNFDIYVTTADDETNVFDGYFDTTNPRLFKEGPGLMVLNHATHNTTGGLFVNGGSLRLNGTWGGNLTVAAGATFGGRGTVKNISNISPSIPINGTIAPGAPNEAATLSFGNNLTFNAGSSLIIKVGAEDATDAVAITGNVNLSNATLVLEPFGKTPSGDRVILTAATLNNTFFAGLPEGSPVRVGTKAIGTISYANNAVTLKNLTPLGGTLLMLK